MKAMILAAGRGERMRPLTDRCPKPLLEAGGRPLIAWHLARLADCGFREVVVNTGWLGHLLRERLGDGSAFGLHIDWSIEPEEAPLETAGGIAHALPLLGNAPFFLINGDIWTDYRPTPEWRWGDDLAHLVLVDNPPHHPEGDFVLGPDGRLLPAPGPRLTYAGMGWFRPEGFRAFDPDRPAPLAPWLRAAIGAGRVSAEHYRGTWADIGTPERLAELDAHLRTTRGPFQSSPPERREWK